MSSVVRFLFITGLALLCRALTTSTPPGRAEAGDLCPGGITVAEAHLPAGQGSVHIAKLFCPGTVVARGSNDEDLVSEQLCDVLGLCTTDVDKPTTFNDEPVRNVSGISCTDSCNTLAGNLPPIIEDCEQIESSISIFVNAGISNFVVKPDHILTLTYGTCRFFFRNMDCVDLRYDWHDLSAAASGSAAACFPPVMPINSEGLCQPVDGTWLAGVSHS